MSDRTHDEVLALPAPERPKLLPAPQRDGGRDGKGDPKRRRNVLLIAAVAILLLLVVGWFFHHRQDTKAKEAVERERDRLPTVGTIAVESSPSTSDLRLPGSVSALTEASLFARASGYLKARYVDIGDTVRRGQVLAEVDAPDLDQQVTGARQQLAQARAAVGDAQARVDLARVTYLRLLTLVKDQAVAQQQVDQSKQDLDTATAGLASSNANVGAAQASVGRLVVLQDYEKVRAPFDGVVTARSVDVGSLVNAAGASSGQSGTAGVASTSSGGSSGASTGATGASSQGGDTQASGGQSTELFRIAQADRVRVFVTVPQENAAAVLPDTDATVYIAGESTPFTGRVTRTAQSLDPTARTLLVEVQVPNADRRLVPGMFAQVRFVSARRGTPLLVPGEAVIARANGLSVAVVEDLKPEDRERLPKKPPASDDNAPKKKDDTAGKTGKEQGKGKSDGSSGGGDGDTKKGRKEDDKGGGSSSGDDDAPPDTDPAHAKRIRLQKVEVGRDYGTEIEITRGLQAGATIVANPGDDVSDGALVMPKPRKAASGGQATQGGAKSDDAKPAGAPGSEAPPPGDASPSMTAPTKGRK